MWLIQLFSAILWFLYFLVYVIFVSGLHSENEDVKLFKLGLIVLSVLMAVVVVLFVFAAAKTKQRKINRKLRVSLNEYFRKQIYSIPIVDFAEENNVKVRQAARFIDYIMDFYGKKLDINEKGVILYGSGLGPLRSGKKRKKRRKK